MKKCRNLDWLEVKRGNNYGLKLGFYFYLKRQNKGLKFVVTPNLSVAIEKG